MDGATRIIPSQPLGFPAPKTASGGKIRAHRIAPERMPRNRLYRLRKTQLCGQSRVGARILGNTIGNAIAGGISSENDTSAQGQSGGSGAPNSFNGPISNMGNFSLPGGISFDLVPPETQIQAAVDGGAISSDQGASALAAVEQIKTNLRDSYVASQPSGASGYQTMTDGGYYIDHATLDARQADVNAFLARNPNSHDQALESDAYNYNSALIDKWDGIANRAVVNNILLPASVPILVAGAAVALPLAADAAGEYITTSLASQGELYSGSAYVQASIASDAMAAGRVGRAFVGGVGNVAYGQATAFATGNEYGLKDATIDFAIGASLGAVAPTTTIGNLKIGLVNNPAIGLPLGAAASDLVGQFTSGKAFSTEQFILNTITAGALHVNLQKVN